MKAKQKKSLAAAKATAKTVYPVSVWSAIVVAVVTFAVFSPALMNEFVRWDDYDLIVDNRHFRGLGWEQLRWMFSSFQQGHYQPLSWITLAIDYYVWGMNPVGYHLTNVVIHAANAALFFFVARELLKGMVPAWTNAFALQAAALFAALFFAVHPLRVESVAWATERRDVLSGFFFLAALFAYIRASADLKLSTERAPWYWVAVFCYGLSLLAKASGVMLPVVLVIFDLYPLRRVLWPVGKFLPVAPSHVWREKVPFVLLALAATVVAPLAQSDAEATASLRAHGLAARVAQSLYGLAFYVWKTVWPADLSPLYEVPPRFDPLAWPFVVSGVIVLGATIIFFSLIRRFPAGLAAWLFYAIMALPVLGFVQSGRQLVADRYSYLPCLAWALIAAGCFAFAWRRTQSSRAGLNYSAIAIGATLLIILSFLTVRQIAVWHDTDSLFKQVLAVTDGSVFKSATGHHFYARLLADRGDLEGAIGHLRSAAAIDPESAEVYMDLGVFLVRRGQLSEGVYSFEKALTLNPKLSVSYYNLGNALALQGRLAEAMDRLHEALRLRPDYPQAYNSLGKIYAAQGKLERAIELFRKAVEIQPQFLEARKNLVAALVENGKTDQAAREMRELRQRQASAGSSQNP